MFWIIYDFKAKYLTNVSRTWKTYKHKPHKTLLKKYLLKLQVHGLKNP